MENDPKEEIHEKSLLAEARRNLEDIARAEAEEAAEAERERSKISDVEETSGSGGNSADLNKMQAAETGAGASVLPLPLSPGQNVQKTTMSSDDSTLSERSGRSVSDASNKVLEPSTFSMKSRESHKDHTNITSNASQDVGHVVAEKSKEDTPGAPNEVEAATNDIADGSMVENSANGLIKEKKLLEDVEKYTQEIHLVEEAETAKCATGNNKNRLDSEAGKVIGAEASWIEIERPQEVTTPNVLSPAIAATLDSTPATQVTGIDVDDIVEANQRIQEADEMIELYYRIQEAGRVIEIDNRMQNIVTSGANNRLTESGGVQMELMMQMLAAAANLGNNVLQEPEVSDDDSGIQRYPGMTDLSAILLREAIHVRNSKPEETDGLSEESSGIQEVSKLTNEKSRINGFVETSKVNSPQDTTEVSEIDRVPDVSEITPIPSAPSISEFSNRRFDTSEFSLQTSDSLKGQDERSSEAGGLKVKEVRLGSSKETEVENAGGQIRLGQVDDQVIRSEPSAVEPQNNTEPEITLNTSAIAALINDESSEGGAVAMAAVLDVNSENTLRLTTAANQPTPNDMSAMTATRKKSLLKRIFSKKARTKLKNDKNKSPERQT